MSMHIYADVCIWVFESKFISKSLSIWSVEDPVKFATFTDS